MARIFFLRRSKLEIFVFLQSSFRYGAAARTALWRPCGSHFTKSRVVVVWGLTQIACHSRWNPSHHRAMARMISPFFQKIVFSFFLHPPIGTAPRPEQLYEGLAAPISQKAALWYYGDSHKLRLIREGIRRTTVPRLGWALRFFGKSFFLAVSFLL